MRSIFSIYALAAISVAGLPSLAESRGAGAHQTVTGGTVRQIRLECGRLARAKYCGGVETHCAKGSPGQKQAKAAIETCVGNGGKL
jgi:hypothetical protein